MCVCVGVEFCMFIPGCSLLDRQIGALPFWGYGSSKGTHQVKTTEPVST